MNITHNTQNHFQSAIDTITTSKEILPTKIAQGVDILCEAISNGCKVLACGNGGSASDAQHFIAELVGRLERERIPFPGIALNTDTSILTAVSNDYGYDKVFERQVEALGTPGDVLVAISTSGNSINVMRAIEMAQSREIKVIALLGKDGGKIGKILQENDVNICVPSNSTMRIQEVHILTLHSLCDGIDTCLLGA